MNSSLDRFYRAIFVLLLLLVAGATQAQTWPSRPLHIRVGWAPGGATDILARVLAQKLQESYGVSVVVENRPGAAGGVDAAALAKSAFDDHTLMMVPPGVQSINQFCTRLWATIRRTTSLRSGWSRRFRTRSPSMLRRG